MIFLLSGSRRMLKPGLVITLCCLLLASAAVCCLARPQFPGEFKGIYKNLKAGGAIESAGCNLCHLNGPPNLNPYGKSVRSALDKAGEADINATVLHSIESTDSDGDGFSNLEEIQADTLPGDATSHPAGKPKSAVGSDNSSGEINPFDLSHIFLAKHAQHPVLVHLPIGLFVASLLFDLLSRFKKNPALNSAAYYNLILAAITGVLAVITGIIAWQWKFAGEALVGNLRIHLILGISTTVLLFVLVGVRKSGKRQITDEATTGYLILAIITALVISLTGHVGGIISGVVS